MKIILSNKQLVNYMLIVDGTTEIGIINEVWKYTEEPVIWKIYFVELSIKNLHKGQVCIEDNIRKPKVYIEGENVWFI